MTQLVMMASDLGLPTGTADKLHDFISLFMKWNRSINLSGARTADQLELHVVDCMHVVRHLRAATASATATAAATVATAATAAGAAPNTPSRVLDVGAGGGLPSIVAALCLPTFEVTALEPVHKKVAFLRVAARELSLDNFVVRAERIEDHGPRDYDAAMSRATFDLRDWLLLGQSYVRPGGVVLGFEAVPRTDLANDTQRHPYSLQEKSRSIVVLQRRY